MENVLTVLLQGLTNLFIIAILFWFFFWDCERHNPIRRYFIPKIVLPFGWIGLNVEWTMFTPDPPMRDMWPMVIFTLEDDSIQYWEPRPYLEFSVLEKIKYKKILKFYFQVTANKADKQIKRDFIEYMLRTHKTKLRCKTIDLYRVIRNTPAIESRNKINEARKELIFTFNPYHCED